MFGIQLMMLVLQKIEIINMIEKICMFHFRKCITRNFRFLLLAALFPLIFMGCKSEEDSYPPIHYGYNLAFVDENGNDLIEIGYKPGKEIGNTLNCLLQLVIEGVYLNEKSELLKYVETTKEWMKLGENYNGKII